MGNGKGALLGLLAGVCFGLYILLGMEDVGQRQKQPETLLRMFSGLVTVNLFTEALVQQSTWPPA